MGSLPSPFDRVIPWKGASVAPSGKHPWRELLLSEALNTCLEGLYSPRRRNQQSSVILGMSHKNAAPRRSSAQVSQWQPVVDITPWNQQFPEETGMGGMELITHDRQQTTIHPFFHKQRLHWRALVLIVMLGDGMVLVSISPKASSQLSCLVEQATCEHVIYL